MTSSSLDNFSRACMLGCPKFRCNSQGSLETAVRQVRERKLTLFKTYILLTQSPMRVSLFSGCF